MFPFRSQIFVLMNAKPTTELPEASLGPQGTPIMLVHIYLTIFYQSGQDVSWGQMGTSIQT